MDINNFINGMDKKRLDNGMQNIKKMMGTKEGQELMNKLKNIDKSTLVKKIGAMNDNSVSNEQIIKEITNDPNLVRKLNDFLKDIK